MTNTVTSTHNGKASSSVSCQPAQKRVASNNHLSLIGRDTTDTNTPVDSIRRICSGNSLISEDATGSVAKSHHRRSRESDAGDVRGDDTGTVRFKRKWHFGGDIPCERVENEGDKPSPTHERIRTDHEDVIPADDEKNGSSSVSSPTDESRQGAVTAHDGKLSQYSGMVSIPKWYRSVTGETLRE